MTAAEHRAEGLAWLRQKRPDAAAEAFRAGLELEPEAVGAWLQYGLALLQGQHLDAAEEAFGWALALDPHQPLGHYNLGRLHQARRRRNEAIAAFRETLRLDPGHQPARLALRRLRVAPPPALSPATPPLGELRLRGVDLLAALKLGLVYGLCLAVVPAVGGALLALAAESPDPLALGLIGAVAALAVTCLNALVLALAFNLAVQWRGPVSLRVVAAGPWLVLAEVDPFGLAVAGTQQAGAYALVTLFFELPLLTTLFGLGEALTNAGLNQTAEELFAGLATGRLVQALLVAGGAFFGLASLTAAYNAAARRRGGLRWRHVWSERWAEVAGVHVAGATGVLYRFSLPVVLGLAVVWALLAAQAWPAWAPPVILVGTPVVAGVVLLLAVLIYNAVAPALGGLRWELEPDV